MKILVVEDDPDIRELVTRSLTQAEYQVKSCGDVNSAQQLVTEFLPDCMVVDWMLPQSSGVELIRWLRRNKLYSQIPVLMLTARSQESDKISGLEAGADDYMTKPMSLRELNARVRALLRRPAQYEEHQDLLEFGSINLNIRTHEVFVGNASINLTKTEFKLMRLFIENPRKVYSREQILDAVWGVNAFLGDRTVDVHILRLRKILRPYGAHNMISTVRGSGYRLSETASN